ncbi:MAG: hypothetical protein VXZ91_02130 [Pseudomonadota bacterium]|nr:hypothetical protein [Pseudomonadota bacterium]
MKDPLQMIRLNGISALRRSRSPGLAGFHRIRFIYADAEIPNY